MVSAFITKGGKRRAVLDKNGKPAIALTRIERIGVVVAVARGTRSYGIGWSLCNTKSGDVFDREAALQSATERATAKYEDEIPQTVAKFIKNTGFLFRAAKAFKGKKLAVRASSVKSRKVRQVAATV